MPKRAKAAAPAPAPTEDPASSGAPRDVKVVEAVLQSMGVRHYDERVAHQLLEFMHRYCGEVCRDGLDYAEHAGRPGQLECEDVHLAAKMKSKAGQVATQKFLEQLARETNRGDLPPAATAPYQLPSRKDCLMVPNYQLVPPPRPPPAPPSDADAATAAAAAAAAAATAAGVPRRIVQQITLRVPAHITRVDPTAAAPPTVLVSGHSHTAPRNAGTHTNNTGT
jgi:transcription initiation factor TFIID subunit 9B